MKKVKTKFPYDYVIDESSKTVLIHFTSNYPTVLALPSLVKEYFGSGYKAQVATEEYLKHLKGKGKGKGCGGLNDGDF